MKRWGFAILLGAGLAVAQRCQEPLYVLTTAELRWTAGANTLSVAAGKTAAACEGDTVEAVHDTQLSYGYATSRPQKRELKAGQRLVLQMPRTAPPVVRGLAATLGENVKNIGQRWFGGAAPRAVEAASRTAEIAKRNVYMPLLALGHNRLVAGTIRIVLPYAEAAAPYSLTLSQGGQPIVRVRSDVYEQRFVLQLAQPLVAGTYRVRLESGNGSVVVDDLEVVAALPDAPPEIAQSDSRAMFYTLWLARQPGWALEAYQQALRLQADFPVLGILVTLMTPSTLEEEQILADTLGQ